MIVPERRDAALLADIMAMRVEAGEFATWWLGQSGFLFKTAHAWILVDPYLSDSLTRKYAGTDRPHVRLTERCLDPRECAFVDVVLSTHGHTDHFDRETLRAIAGAAGRSRPLQVVLPAAIEGRAAEMFAGLDVTLHPVDVGEALTLAEIQIDALPAAHPTLARDESGRHLFLGFGLQLGRWRVYHSGDTVWHDDVLRAAQRLRPDVALLPINGQDPARRVAGNLDPVEAAEWAARLGVRLAIPHHFGMFAFNTADPADFAMACRSRGVRYEILACAGSWHSRVLRNEGTTRVAD